MPDISARTLGTTALRLLGVASAEQPLSADMAQSTLHALNSMLDSWGTEKLLTYTRPHYALLLEPGRRTYSWGLVPGEPVAADISAPAPVALDIALLNIGGTPELEWPLQILSQAEYEQEIVMKHFAAEYPGAVYLANAQPYNILTVYPVPTVAYTLRLLPWQALSPYGAWDDVLSWPMGYERPIIYNLAVDLGPQYGVEASPTVMRIAEESKRALYVPNTEVGRLSLWPGRPAHGSPLGLPRGFLEGTR